MSARPVRDNASGEHQHRKPPHRTSSRERDEEVRAKLDAIYKNENGDLPDMTTIEVRKTSLFAKIATVFVTLVVVGSFGVWIVLAFFSDKSPAAKEGVQIAVSGPTEARFGVASTYVFSYKNNTDRPLEKTVATLRYPVGFVVVTTSLKARNAGSTEWDLGTIPAHSSADIKVTGFLFGRKGETRTWRGVLSYQAESINSLVQETASFESKVGDNPVTVSVMGPAEVASGSDDVYTFTVKLAATPFPYALELVPALKEGGKVVSSTPAINKAGRWTIPVNTPTSTHVFSARVQPQDSGEGTTEIGAALQVIAPSLAQPVAIAEGSIVSKITSPVLDGVVLSVNGNTGLNHTSAPGETLTIAFSFKNTTGAALKNGTARLIFQAPSLNRQSILDWSKLKDPLDGDVRGEQISDVIRQGVISWAKDHESKLANLAPDQELVFNVTLPIRGTDRFDLSLVNERTIRLTGGLSFVNASGTPVVYSLTPRVITLGSNLSFEMRREALAPGASANEHQVTWMLTNSLNSLKNITVQADLFGDVSVAGMDAVPVGSAAFDAGTKKLTWSIPELPETLDVAAWPFKVTLKSSNTTQTTLISKVMITGEDAVTGEKISLTGNPLLVAR